MAKLSGPEEFFEVFHERRGQPPKEPLPPAGPQPGQSPFGGDRPKTVTITVRTLMAGIFSSLLLMVLCVFVGMAIAKAPSTQGVQGEPRPLVQQTGRPGGSQERPVDTGSAGIGEGEAPPDNREAAPPQPPQQQKVWVIAVVSYAPSAREYADEFRKFLTEQDFVKSFRVHVGCDIVGNKRLVYVGPFASADDPIAKNMLAAIRKMRYGNSTFGDAGMMEITMTR